MKEPRDLAAEIETGARRPEGPGERFFGYSVLGLPFRSGHVLALRRFPASSIGPGYTSVWHRGPEGGWTFYQSVSPRQACSRYFGRLVKESLIQDIAVTWTGPRSFTVSSDGEHRLVWQVAVTPTAATQAMNALGQCLPRSWWEKPAVLTLMGGMARCVLGTGKVRLIGRAPNGQTFLANPFAVWLVSESRATVDGQDLGPMGPLSVQANLGEFLIPQRGLFAIGSAFLESFDETRHLAVTSQAEIQRPKGAS